MIARAIILFIFISGYLVASYNNTVDASSSGSLLFNSTHYSNYVVIGHISGVVSSQNYISRIGALNPNGGAYKVYLFCPSSIYVGQSLNCNLVIQNEGDLILESTSTVWIDNNNSGGLDAGEPQVSFSKITQPRQSINLPVSLYVPSYNPTGLIPVMVNVEYLGSSQPNSTSSVSVQFFVSSARSGEVIGSASSITAQNIANISMVINGSSPQAYYSSTMPVNILSDGKTIVSFDYDFNSASLNLSNIVLLRGTTANGSTYVSVRGINANNGQSGTKTIKLYDTNSSFNSVCVKNSDAASINDASSTCVNSDEIQVPCDGANGSIACARSGSTLTVSGLQHSLVFQINLATPPSETPGSSSGSGGAGGGGAGMGGAAGNGAAGGNSGASGESGGAGGSSTSSAQSKTLLYVEVGNGKVCGLSLLREIASGKNKSIITNTLVNTGTADCVLDDVRFKDSIPQSLSSNRVKFSLPYESFDGQSVTFKFSILPPNESRTVQYSFYGRVPSSRLKDFSQAKVLAKIQDAAQPSAQQKIKSSNRLASRGKLMLLDYPKEIVLGSPEPLSYSILVKNIGGETLRSTSILIPGLPFEYFTVEPEVADITAGETQEFKITLAKNDGSSKLVLGHTSAEISSRPLQNALDVNYGDLRSVLPAFSNDNKVERQESNFFVSSLDDSADVPFSFVYSPANKTSGDSVSAHSSIMPYLSLGLFMAVILSILLLLLVISHLVKNRKWIRD